ncbi:MAG: ATP phosphoribosyltransferase regulatory subunit [Firmicutes bacterium]|nr:ATP phosphoribosyltransferase regulatory subunit [Bacillota bacterium]
MQRPRGTRDYLAGAADLIREIEATIREIFRLWGYSEVITPTFEYMEVLRQGTGPESDEMIFRFFDREGNILGLRSDATTPIARLAATRFNDENRILRLAYLTNIFRYVEPGMGREREFHQAGVELIGSSSPKADAEVIQLAATVFEALGITGYALDLGEVSFSLGILEDSGLSPREQRLIRGALLNKDFVTLKEILAAAHLPSETQEQLEELLALRGGVEVISRAKELTKSSTSQAALEHLEAVCELLPDQVLERVRIDLGMLKDLEYYTGVVFEGYVADIGYTVCSGGRYDRLIGRFGADKPAVGFGFGLERLLELKAATAEDQKQRVVVVDYNDPLRERAQELAARLREAGHTAVVSLNKTESKEAELNVLVTADSRFEIRTKDQERTAISLDEVVDFVNELWG